MNNQPEYRLQCSVVEWLEYQFPQAVFCATLGGVHQTLIQGVRLKKQGYRKGIPDLMIYNPNFEYVGLAIEFKVAYNKTSEYQNAWRKKLDMCHWQIAVVYDFETAQKIISNYFQKRLDIP